MTDQQVTLCQLFLSGKSKVDSYLEAGYSDQGTRKKNASAAYAVFNGEAVKRYLSTVESRFREGVRAELGIEDDDDPEDHQLVDLGPDTVEDYVEVLEEKILERAGMLRRLEKIANALHRACLYEDEMKPLQEISKIMGFYKPSQVEVSAVNFQLDLGGPKPAEMVDDGGLDPETLRLARESAPAMIGDYEDEDEDEGESGYQDYEIPDLEDL